MLTALGCEQGELRWPCKVSNVRGGGSKAQNGLEELRWLPGQARQGGASGREWRSLQRQGAEEQARVSPCGTFAELKMGTRFGLNKRNCARFPPLG